MVVPGMVRSCAAWDGVRRASVFNCCITPRCPLSDAVHRRLGTGIRSVSGTPPAFRSRGAHGESIWSVLGGAHGLAQSGETFLEQTAKAKAKANY